MQQWAQVRPYEKAAAGCCCLKNAALWGECNNQEKKFLLPFISLHYLLWYLNVTPRIHQVPWALEAGSPLDPEQQTWNLGELMLQRRCNTKGKKKVKPTNGGYLTDLKKIFAAPSPASLGRINALLPFQPTFSFPFAFPENGMFACSPWSGTSRPET